jgi:hypothetical protein
MLGFSGFLVFHVLPYLGDYMYILLFSAVVIWFIYKFILCSIYEFGLLWAIFFGVLFSLADCIFLYSRKLIIAEYFYTFIITTAIYYFVICFLHIILGIKKKYRIIAKKKILIFDNTVYVYGICLFILWVILSIFKLNILGARNFNKIGGGSGAIIRLLWLTGPLLNFTMLYIFFYGNEKKKKLFYLYLLSYIFFSYFSNSKSSIISIFFSMLIFRFMNPNCDSLNIFLKKYSFFFILAGVFFSITLLMLMTNTTFINGFLGLLYRFIAFGDVYTFAYPGQVIDIIRAKVDVSFFKYIFSDLLSMYRLVGHEYFVDCNVAGMLVEEVAGKGISEGPNARFNVLGYIFWGYGGVIIFSVFCAVIFTLVHIVFINSVNGSYKRQFLGFYLADSLIALEQDAVLIPQFLGSITLLFFIVLGIELLIVASRPLYFGALARSC